MMDSRAASHPPPQHNKNLKNSNAASFYRKVGFLNLPTHSTHSTVEHQKGQISIEFEVFI